MERGTNRGFEASSTESDRVLREHKAQLGANGVGFLSGLSEVVFECEAVVQSYAKTLVLRFDRDTLGAGYSVFERFFAHAHHDCGLGLVRSH